MNTNIYNTLTNFIKKRTIELFGLILVFLGIVLLIAFITYSPTDPSFAYDNDAALVQNFFGLYFPLLTSILTIFPNKFSFYEIILFVLSVIMFNWSYL